MPHSLQATFYSETTKDEDDRLVEDLRDNGQRDAIVVAPRKDDHGHWIFIILDGHRRVSAAGVLGWNDLDALIRWDLAEADEATIEAEFLRHNLNRRHIHKLDQARIVMRLFEIEKKRPRNSLRLSPDEPEARDRVGRLLGMSGRHLQRMFRILLARYPSSKRCATAA